MPKQVWSKRYELINDFEKMLHENGTRILKFYLHISPEEQLERFKQRLDDPSRHWKISETDYSERELWPDYIEAFEDAMERTSTKHAPWYVIPSNHKWFRNLAISEIVADTLEDMDLKLPPTQVDIADIRRKYHAAATQQDGAGPQAAKGVGQELSTPRPGELVDSIHRESSRTRRAQLARSSAASGPSTATEHCATRWLASRSPR